VEPKKAGECPLEAWTERGSDQAQAFTDVQEFEDRYGLGAVGSRYIQIDHGTPTFAIDDLRLEGVCLRRYWSSHALNDEFVVRDGWTTFVVTPAPGTEAMWNGRHASPDSLSLLRSGRDHMALLPAGWSCVEVDVSDEVVRSHGVVGERFFAGAMSTDKATLRLTSSDAEATRRTLLGLLDFERAAAPGLLREKTERGLRRRILDLLAIIAETGCPDSKTMTAHRSHRLVRRARSLIDEQLTDNPEVAFLSKQLGVSARSLQRAFRGAIGVTPKQFILARKLDAARREIRRRGSLGSIVDIAYDFGFVSASRFSEQYRRQFGHPPSTVTRVLISLPDGADARIGPLRVRL
jgi:AraC family transcriptional regulator, ethanolamine operon transcriptional activator